MRKLDDIDRVMSEYGLFLQMEKGMAGNTREAYMRDVRKLLGYLAESGVKLRDVTADTLRYFIGELHDLGIAERSQARIVSGDEVVFPLSEHGGLSQS